VKFYSFVINEATYAPTTPEPLKTMIPQQLFEQIRKKKSFLCVGLDSDLHRIPAHLRNEKDPVFAFNRAIIEATQAYAVAYKPNLAFYEAMGSNGWESLRKTLKVIPPEIMVIADAKRGDIGNTAQQYARAFFETMEMDAITLSPYMGKDAITPFLERPGKWAFALALTSNAGAADLQYHDDGKEKLYERVVRLGQEWQAGQPGELGYVVGATRPEALADIRALAPNAFFLVPGVGAQGGDLEAVCRHGRNEQGGLLINSSRGIIYAGKDRSFQQKAAEAAAALQQQMAPFIAEL
jgi:orotidine-5'-phosphate decarboxylase